MPKAQWVMVGMMVVGLGGAIVGVARFQSHLSPTARVGPLEVVEDVPGVPMNGFEGSSDRPSDLRPATAINAIDLVIPRSILNRISSASEDDPVLRDARLQALVTSHETILNGPSLAGASMSIHGPLVNIDRSTRITNERLSLDEATSGVRHIGGSVDVVKDGHTNRVEFEATVRVDSEDPVHVLGGHVVWKGPYAVNR